MSERVIYKNNLGCVYVYDDVRECVIMRDECGQNKMTQTSLPLPTNKDHHGREYVIIPGLGALGRVFIDRLRSGKFWETSVLDEAYKKGVSKWAIYKKRQRSRRG